MEEIRQIASVPIITSLIYVALSTYKYFARQNESLIKLIPTIAVVLGCILGVSIYYGAPQFIPASNVFSAILVGSASGLAATGTHQIFKQLQKAGSQTDETVEQQLSDTDVSLDTSKDSKTIQQSTEGQQDIDTKK